MRQISIEKIDCETMKRMIFPTVRCTRRVGGGKTSKIHVAPLARRYASSHQASSSWRPASALDEYVESSSSPEYPVAHLHRWVEKEARPVSLRQLTVFGRSLTESRLINSANYVRTELPTRYNACLMFPCLNTGTDEVMQDRTQTS